MATVLAVFVLGLWLGGHPSWLPSGIRDAFESDSSTPLVNTVLNAINQDYYRKVSRGQLVNKGLVAMVSSLDDPYSHYYSPSAYQAFLNQSNRHFHGIGVDVVKDSQGLRILDVFPDSLRPRPGFSMGT